MIVVSDTSPLNYLALIGHTDVLPVLFDTVYVPPAVLAELSHSDTPTAVRAWIGTRAPWLVVRSPATLDPSLHLDRGETEAISLALELGAQLLVDERLGREAASRLGVRVAGTLAVLSLAAERKLLDLPMAVNKLRATTFRASEALYQAVLRKAGDTR